MTPAVGRKDRSEMVTSATAAEANPAAESDLAVRVTDLRVATGGGVEIVDGVSLSVAPGRLMGLLGETGAGKTVTARAMLGLLPKGLVASGTVRFGDDEPLDLGQPSQIARHLGRTAGLMLQNPMGGFDPLQRVGPQLIESVVRNELMSKQAATERAGHLCERLGLGDPRAIFRIYPHQLSGGMAQRVALALTMMPSPKVLVVDEPTSALDANLRVEALTLVQSVAREDNTAIVLISHDLGLVSRFCDEVAVLYAGHLVETGPTTALLRTPAHPYSRTLISCSLRLDTAPRTPLPTVGGEPPLPGAWPSGCYFHPRCPQAEAICRTDRPEFRLAAGRGAACHFADLNGGDADGQH